MEAIIPKKKTTIAAISDGTGSPDFLDGLGLQPRVVGLLRAAGLITPGSIEAASLKAAPGIGPAIAARVLEAVAAKDGPAPEAANAEAVAEADAEPDPSSARDLDRHDPEPAVDDGDGDLETTLLRVGPSAAPGDPSSDLLFAAAHASAVVEPAEGPPAIVPVYGGHLSIERLSGDRRRVVCADPYLSYRFVEACASVNAPLSDDGSAVLPYETCRMLVAGMKDASIRRDLRTWTQNVSRLPSLVTAHGRVSVTVYATAGGVVASVRPLENDGRIENRLDLVCNALGGRWNDEKASWSIPQESLGALAAALDVLPEGAPPSPADARRAAAVDRRPPAAEKDGLAYAIDENGKADKEWYRRAGRRDDVEVLGGIVHIYHVDDRTWLAAKHDGDGAVNAAIKDAVARTCGYQGYHGPLNGHKFPAGDAGRLVAELKRIDSLGRPATLI